jgi:hypothetical protein
MPPKPLQAPTFLTREQLALPLGTAFSLRITTQSNNAVPLTIRGMTKEGVFTLVHNTTSDGTDTSTDFRLPDLPIFISVYDDDFSFTQSSCHVSVDLLANEDRLYCLFSGNVYAQKGLSWPQTTTQDLIPNRGTFMVFTSDNPAAGAEISISVPNKRIWRIIGLRFQLVNAAVAASRRVHVVMTHGEGCALDFFSDVDQITGETRNYTCAAVAGNPDRIDDNDIIIPIAPDIWLPEGSTITTETTALNAGDNFGTCAVMLEQFFMQN